ncbi:MAG: hypothetical protein KGJ23_07350 [Euryarchaeota archaeon]|nr:hypothetical protein [Euryarchaeota archaeon]MDE1836416.1 hypothetical protein [Euryarchaeota archaeon]MDE1879069.1 hypothetical protein [Euryarchaeota archaeon]MDE2044164.1 hypothetical protein [Thermoplasmata archaeon]
MVEGKAPRPFEAACADIARAFDEACASALRADGLEGVYVSPLWEEKTSDPGRSRAWKRSVLRRLPGAGAESWGHLWIVALRDGRRRVMLRPDSEMLPTLEGPSTSELQGFELGAGPPRILLWARARSPDTEERLMSFVQELRTVFVPPSP